MAEPTDPKNSPVDPVTAAAVAKNAENTAKASADATEQIKQFQKYLAESAISTEKIRQELEQINKDIVDNNRQGRSQLEMEMKKNELQKQYNERLIEENQKRLDNLKNSKDINEEEKKKLESAIETLKIQNKYLSSKDDELDKWTGINDQASALLSSMTGVTGRSETMISAIAEAGIEAGNVGGAFEAASFAIDKMGAQFFNFKNLLLASIDMAVQLGKEQDAAFADFEKRAGDVQKYEAQISKLTLTNGKYGISVQDAANAYANLKTELVGFDKLSVATQEAIATTTAQLEKLGVSSADSAKTMSMLVKGFQMTGQQAANFQKQMYATAKAMGIPPTQAAKDFAASSPRLAAYGKDMTRVFLDLQKTAQNTGISFDRLLGMTEKFDTFEGAADAAGQLNAILGGDLLNSVDLMNADEGERIRLMQDALKLSGKTFESMDRFEKKAVAQAMGIQDITELQKLMNNENRKSAVDLMNAESAQKEMNAAIEDATQLMDMFKTFTMKLGTIFWPIIRPIVNILKELFTTLIEGFDAMSEVQYALIGFVGDLWNATKSAFPFIVTVIDKIKSIAFAISDFLDQARSEYKWLDIVIKIAKFAVAVGILYGIWVLASRKIKSVLKDLGGGVQEVVEKVAESVTEGTNTAAEAAQENGKKIGTGLGDAIKEVGKAASESKSGILALGAAFLMIGIGIGIAALGLAELVKAFSTLTGEQILGGLGALIIVMLGFAGMLYILTLASGVAAVPMLALGAAFLMIGAGIAIAAAGIGYMISSIAEMFKALNTVKAENIEKAFDALFDSISITRAGKLGTFALAIKGFGESLMTLNANLVVASTYIQNFTNSFNSLTAISEKISSVTNSIIALTEALSKPINSSFAESLQKISESIEDMSVIKIAALATVAANTTTSETKPTVASSPISAAPIVGPTISPATTAATAAATNTAAASTNNTENKLIPVAIYIDGKKLGEILDPTVKKAITDKLNQIGGTAKLMPE